MEEQTLLDYLKSKDLTIADFAKMTGVSQSHLYKIQTDRNANLMADNARKIFHATKEKYGKGLDIWDYLNR